MIVNHTQLNKYNRSNLDEIERLGSGSFGSVKLFYDQESEERIVGKLFVSTGEQNHIDNDLANAEREAKLLAQFSHINIIKVLGALQWDDYSFMIIMEYAPCKDLEHVLMSDKDIDLPWKLRARFFTELANALDYLHNHDPKKAYIHGDLKPQNVLLGDAFKIKLGDFGAATIARLTGTTIRTTISGDTNNQHTPLYSAPEYLNKPTMEKKCNMDVYSYAMVGYEILTRQVIYSGGGVPGDLLLSLIMQTGLKPNEKSLDDVANDIKENSGDLAVLHKLRMLVEQCWQFDPKDRPKIFDVKKNLDQLSRTENIYGDETDNAVKLFIEKIQLQSERHLNDQSKKIQDDENKPFGHKRNLKSRRHESKKSSIDILKQWIPISITAVIVSFIAVFCYRFFSSKDNYAFIDYFVANLHQASDIKTDHNRLTRYQKIYATEIDEKAKSHIQNENLNPKGLHEQPNNTTMLELWSIWWFCLIALGTVIGYFIIFSKINTSSNVSSGFLVADGYRLKKYDVNTKNITNLLYYPNRDVIKEHSKQVLQIKNMVYVISSERSFQKSSACVMKTNLSNPTFVWKEVKWKKEDMFKKFIVCEQSIFAVGGRDERILTGFLVYDKSPSFVLYNNSTGTWKNLPNMNEARDDHTLVLFQGSICAIAGDHFHTVEWFNPTLNEWIFLPSMNIVREYAAAVELNSELYVIGGTDARDENHKLSAVEKFNPVTNLWTQVADLNEPRERFAAAGVFNGKIYVIGGGSSTVEAYDPSTNVWKVTDNKLEFDRKAKFALFQEYHS